MKKSIGIDLGSTMSEVAVIEGNEPVIIASKEGSRTFPSIVGFDPKTNERIVGVLAKRKMLMNPKGTINLVKRLMGRKFEEEEVQKTIKHVQYDIVNHNGWAYIKIGDKEYSPQEVSSWILAELKKMAEEYCGTEITDAVITVPALFPQSAREATKEAGMLAGLNVERIINEPTAACLASKLEKSGRYIVTDFGGSTLDNSVVDFDKDNITMEILASNGDNFLGGADIDNEIVNYLVDIFQKEEGFDLRKDPMAMTRLYEAAEQAKIELSASAQTEVNIPYITIVDGTPKHLKASLNQAKFEQLITPIVDKVINSAKIAVKDSKVDKLDGIILVGGSCRIPYVQKRLKEDLNAELYKKADLDLAVAQGASIQANILAGNTSSTDILLLDVTPLSLGIETLGGVMTKLVEANTTIPTKKSEVFSTAADNQPSVEIHVLQGERQFAKDNKTLGVFVLDSIPMAPRGIPKIEVTFNIDANGIVTVSAKDLGTGKEQHITIQNATALSDEEIEKIKAEAASHKEEDAKKAEEIQTLNASESYYYSIKEFLKANAEKVSADEKTALDEALDKLKATIDNKNVSDLQSARDAVDTLYKPVVTKIYSEAAGPSTESNGASDFTEAFTSEGPSASADGEPTDVDFEEVK